MLLNTSTQQCEHCKRENNLNAAHIQTSDVDSTIMLLPACACGAREMLRICTVEENNGSHAELVRQFAAIRGTS